MRSENIVGCHKYMPSCYLWYECVVYMSDLQRIYPQHTALPPFIVQVTAVYAVNFGGFWFSSLCSSLQNNPFKNTWIYASNLYDVIVYYSSSFSLFSWEIFDASLFNFPALHYNSRRIRLNSSANFSNRHLLLTNDETFTLWNGFLGN